MALIQDVGRETPTLKDVIQSNIRSALLEINTCIPAVIDSYDSTTRTAEVIPAIKRTKMDGSFISRATLPDVPVVFPYNGSKGITYPLETGSPCLLVISQRSIDDWVLTKGETEPKDARLHDINDAFCIAGIGSVSDVRPLKEGMQIAHDKIWIGNPESLPMPLTGLSNTELVQIISKFLELMATPLQSSMGPVTYDPQVAAQFQEMKSALDELVP